MTDHYYSDKIQSLREILGRDDIRLEPACLVVGDKTYPIVDDVIVLLEPSRYPAKIRRRIGVDSGPESAGEQAGREEDFSEDVQFSFGREWNTFSKMLPEHEEEFHRYFDLVDLDWLAGKRVLDVGCGMGRWSFLLRDKCRELVLVDFSEAVFAARNLLRDSSKAIFFMGDIHSLPFGENCADFLFCLGVLHHMPTDALDEVRALKKYSNKLLIYLYYALDNKPFYFRWILAMVTLARLTLSRIRNAAFRKCFTWFGAFAIYYPCIWTGRAMKPLGLSRYVPLIEHDGQGLEGIRLHVYDRFFTKIEQRVTRKQIRELEDTFSRVVISENPGYWHFLCEAEGERRQCNRAA